MANQLNLNLSPLGASVVSYTVQYRALGSNIWLNSNVIPNNPISSSVLNPYITLPTDNTIYQVQLLSNCGTNIAQSIIQRFINRGCPIYSALNLNSTDVSISGVFPLNTPSPISTHISSINIQLFIGTTLVNSQIISTPTAFNSFIFTSLISNTVYSLVFVINYTFPDTISPAYSLGDSSSQHLCLGNSFTTAASAICPVPVIISITQS